MRKFGKNAEEQMKLKKQRFKNRQRHKPVLCERIERRNKREEETKKLNLEELND